MTKRREDSLASMLEEEFNIVIESGDKYIEAIIEEVDASAQEYSDEVNRTIPVDSGKLKASHKFSRKVTKDYIKYTFEFEGETEDGQSYEKIANIHEYGTSDGKIKATRFQRKAVKKKLKGLDKRAVNRYKNKGGQV